jgi:hypothetical protein
MTASVMAKMTIVERGESLDLLRERYGFERLLFHSAFPPRHAPRGIQPMPAEICLIYGVARFLAPLMMRPTTRTKPISSIARPETSSGDWLPIEGKDENSGRAVG